MRDAVKNNPTEHVHDFIQPPLPPLESVQPRHSRGLESVQRHHAHWAARTLTKEVYFHHVSPFSSIGIDYECYIVPNSTAETSSCSNGQSCANVTSCRKICSSPLSNTNATTWISMETQQQPQFYPRVYFCKLVGSVAVAPLLLIL
ncbi:hypothetical protein HHUSO_G1754 [Huso huso]|uniref:Uncharacterized protein n=1 Tax=Huso huso TaxID=61971 RepID=A0ABR1A5P6_HUSHU